ETYLGYEQGRNFASSGAELDRARTYELPESLTLNHWALSGEWAIERRACVLEHAGGRIAFRFHARAVHLVMAPRPAGTPVPVRVLLDGAHPGDAHGLDVDEHGNGVLEQPRLYQLIRRRSTPVADDTFEIEYASPGVEAYVFTFG